MSWWALVLGMVGVVAPARVAVSLGATPRQVLSAGLALSVALLAAVGWASGPLLSGLDVSEPNARVAAGMLVGLTGVLDLVRPRAAAVEVPSSRWAALAPVAWPVVLRPAAALLAVSGGADHGVGAVVVAAVAAVLLAWLAALRPLPGYLRWGLHGAGAGLAVVFGIDILVDGVFDV